MLDQKLSVVIRALINVERRRRIAETRTAIRTFVDDVTQRGQLGHGRVPVELERICATELENRGKAWLSIARRAFAESSTRWTAVGAETLAELLRAELRSDWDALLDVYRESARLQNDSRRFGSLDEARGRVEEEMANELQLSVLGEDRARVPVTEQLMSPRYAAVLTSWRRAIENARATGDQRNEAIRDAIGAVEQLARILTASPSATLGECLTTLKGAKQVDPPLLHGIKEIWGWTSSTPGIRHGASLENPSSAESEYCLKVAEGSLVLLLSLDAA